MEKRISMRDIARILGIHHTTVSLALRDSPLLNAKTKQKIHEEAKKLGYEPDPMLKALNVYRQSKRPVSFHAVIGWINNWRNRDALLAVPTYRDYYQGACDSAAKFGYSVQEFWMHEKGMTVAKMERILKARNITGLLIAPQAEPGVSVGLDFNCFSSVAFGYSTQPCMLHLVTCHHAQAIDLLMSKLVDLGYYRPGYCIPSWTDSGGNHIWISRLAYLYSKYPHLKPLPRAPSLKKEPLAKWIRKYKPDVLIGYNDLLSSIEALGYKVPQDIGFVTLNIDSKDLHISGIDENDFQIGKAAMDLLVGMLHRGERGIPDVPMRTLLDSKWFAGETLCRQKSAAPTTIPTTVFDLQRLDSPKTHREERRLSQPR